MVLQPRGTRVLVKRTLVTKKGSLYVPTNSREMKHNLGTVISVGPDCEDLKEGDMVLFGQYAPLNMDKMELEAAGVGKLPQDEEYLLMNEEDILCQVLADEIQGVVNA